jgi:hypothetical protein
VTYSLDEDEEEKSARDREEDHFQCETGDAEAAVDGVSPQRGERPSGAGGGEGADSGVDADDEADTKSPSSRFDLQFCELNNASLPH